jgi:hypothetical protein
MPVDRSIGEGVGEELRRLYGALEEGLAREVAAHLRKGIDRPDWLSDKLRSAGIVRRAAERLVSKVLRDSSGQVEKAVRTAFERGASAAQAELQSKRAAPRVQQSLPGAQNINRLASGLAGRLEATQPRVVRSVLDAYRQTVTAGSAEILGGAATRRQAAERVWNNLLRQGFTGFTDVRGRNWSLAGYVDMATRTTVAQAAVAGHLDRLAESGIDLVIVSNAPQECSRCRPAEGKIYTRDDSGRGGATIEVEHALDDKIVKVRVEGALSEAIQSGLFHPNCRHSVSAYLPGVTKPITHTRDPEGDKARQQLRALERQARAARLQEAGALTPEATAAAKAKLRDVQGKIKAHVEATKDLGIRRKPERERLDLGNRADASVPAPARKALDATPPPPDPAPPVRLPDPPSDPATGKAALDAAPARMKFRIRNPEASVLQQEEIGELEWSGGRPSGISQADADKLSELMHNYMQEIGDVAPWDLREGNDTARKLIDKLMATSVLTKPIQVWRGLNRPRLLFGDRLDGDLTGAEVTEAAVQSTSPVRAVAARYAAGQPGQDPGLLLRLVTRRGVKAVALGHDEREILLQRGLRLVVVADRRERGLRVLDVIAKA